MVAAVSRCHHPRGRTSTVALIAAQILGAALTAVMGGIHLDLWVGGYRDIPTIGVLFLLNSIGAVLLAIALLVTHVRLLSFVSAGGFFSPPAPSPH